MTRGLFESGGQRTLQQQLHEDYIIKKITELQYSRDRVSDARRLNTAMKVFVEECGEAGKKFISGLGIILGCPQSAEAMPVVAVGASLITEVSTALLVYAANNPDMYQRFASQLWNLGGFVYGLYQKGNGVISERRKASRGLGVPKVRSGGSGGGTLMPDPEEPKKRTVPTAESKVEFHKQMTASGQWKRCQGEWRGYYEGRVGKDNEVYRFKPTVEKHEYEVYLRDSGKGKHCGIFRTEGEMAGEVLKDFAKNTFKGKW